MHGFTRLFVRLEWIILSHNMGTCTTVSPRRLVATRYERYRHIGPMGVSWREWVRGRDQR